MDQSTLQELTALTKYRQKKRPAVVQLTLHWRFVHSKTREVQISNITRKIVAFAVTPHILVTSRRNFCMPTMHDVDWDTKGPKLPRSEANGLPPRKDSTVLNALKKMIADGYWKVHRISYNGASEELNSDEGDGKDQGCTTSQYKVVGKTLEDNDLITIESAHAHHRVELGFTGREPRRQGRCFGVSFADQGELEFNVQRREGEWYTFTAGTWSDANGLNTATSHGYQLPAGSPVFIRDNGLIKVAGVVSRSLDAMEEIDVHVTEFSPASMITLLLYCSYGIEVRERMKGETLEVYDIPLSSAPLLYVRDESECSYVEMDEKFDDYDGDIFRKPNLPRYWSGPVGIIS